MKIPDDETCCLLKTAPKLDATVEAALKTGALVDGDFPPRQWWEMFGDKTLNSLVQAALSESPDLKAAQARVAMAFEEAQAARSGLFPSLGLQVGVDWGYYGKNDFFRAFTEVFPANIAEYLIQLDFTYEFDFWSKNRNRYRARLGEARAKEAEYEAAKLVLTTSVCSAYAQYVSLSEKWHVLEKEQGNVKGLLGLSETRQKSSLENRQQLLNAREHLKRIEQNILFTKEQMTLAKHLIKRLVGLGPDAQLDLSSPRNLGLPNIPIPRHLSSDLLARRPDLMARIWIVESAAHLVGVAKAEFYPRIDLCAIGGLDSVFFSRIFDTKSLSSMVYPSLHLPIFTAGRLRANLRAQEAYFHASIYEYNQTLLNAVQEVADSIVTLQKIQGELSLQKERVQNRAEYWQLAQLRYTHALDPLDPLLEAHNPALEQQITQIGMQYEKQIATFQLVKALGGGFCQAEVPYE